MGITRFSGIHENYGITSKEIYIRYEVACHSACARITLDTNSSDDEIMRA